jgi:copper transport protein
MAMMIMIAAVQTIRWRRDDSKLSHAGLRLELLIGVFTVFVAILISQMAYPMPTKSYAKTITATESTEKAVVHISQLSVGNQVLTAQLPTQHGGQPTKVTLFLVMPDMDTGEQEITVTQTASGEYQATLGFSMVGAWQYTIEAQYPHDIKLRWTDTIRVP